MTLNLHELSPEELAALSVDDARRALGIGTVPSLVDEPLVPLCRAGRASTPVQGVLQEVLAERRRQDGRWGPQDHPITPERRGAHGDAEDNRELYAEAAEGFKRLNDEDVANETLGWDRILLEEVYEALAESDPRKVREELVQVAAVAVAAIESLDRNELAGAR